METQVLSAVNSPQYTVFIPNGFQVASTKGDSLTVNSSTYDCMGIGLDEKGILNIECAIIFTTRIPEKECPVANAVYSARNF